MRYERPRAWVPGVGDLFTWMVKDIPFPWDWEMDLVARCTEWTESGFRGVYVAAMLGAEGFWKPDEYLFKKVEEDEIL